ncbi:hypothetical protein Tco_1443708 [Tanacetum coccineum]
MAVLKSWGCDPKPGYELMDKSKTGSYTLVAGLHELGQTDVGGGLEWPRGPGSLDMPQSVMTYSRHTKPPGLDHTIT